MADLSTAAQADACADLYLALSQAGCDLLVAADFIHRREGCSAAYRDIMRAADRVADALQQERKRQNEGQAGG